MELATQVFVVARVLVVGFARAGIMGFDLPTDLVVEADPKVKEQCHWLVVVIVADQRDLLVAVAEAAQTHLVLGLVDPTQKAPYHYYEASPTPVGTVQKESLSVVVAAPADQKNLVA